MIDLNLPNSFYQTNANSCPKSVKINTELSKNWEIKGRGQRGGGQVQKPRKEVFLRQIFRHGDIPEKRWSERRRAKGGEGKKGGVERGISLFVLPTRPQSPRQTMNTDNWSLGILEWKGGRGGRRRNRRIKEERQDSGAEDTQDIVLSLYLSLAFFHSPSLPFFFTDLTCLWQHAIDVSCHRARI